MAGKNVIEGIRSEAEKLGLELLELDQASFGAGFLLLGVVESLNKKVLSGGEGGIYIKEFFNTLLEVKSFLDLLPFKVQSTPLEV